MGVLAHLGFLNLGQLLVSQGYVIDSAVYVALAPISWVSLSPSPSRPKGRILRLIYFLASLHLSLSLLLVRSDRFQPLLFPGVDFDLEVLVEQDSKELRGHKMITRIET